MNIIRTSGKGGRSEAALGPGRGRGSFPKIFPFSMAVPDYQPFLVFGTEPLVSHRYQSQLLAVPLPGCLSPSALQELKDHYFRQACPSLATACRHPPPSLREHWAEVATSGPLLVHHSFAWVWPRDQSTENR